MKLIRYKIVGGVGGKTKLEGTLAELFVQIPYASLSGLIPPYEVARDLFGRGVVDYGMSGGCEWPPLSLTRADYEDFAEDLLTRPGTEACPLGFERDATAAGDCTTWEQWDLRRAGRRSKGQITER